MWEIAGRCVAYLAQLQSENGAMCRHVGNSRGAQKKHPCFIEEIARLGTFLVRP